MRTVNKRQVASGVFVKDTGSDLFSMAVVAIFGFLNGYCAETLVKRHCKATGTTET